MKILQILLVFTMSMFLLLIFVVESLLKKILIFIGLVLVMITLLSNWVSYLMVLLYLGGLFVLMVFMSFFSFKTSFKFTFLGSVIGSLGFFWLDLKEFKNSIGFWSISSSMSGFLALGFLFFLIMSFFYMSKILPSGKTLRNI